MAPSFFLKQFGISVITTDDENSGDTVLINEPPKIKKRPKISPLGFEIFEEDAPTIVGTSIFVQVDGNPGNPSSSWETIAKDDDGDLTVDVDIDDAIMARKFYIKLGETLVKVPDNMKNIDDDLDIQINATNLFLSWFKLSNMMKNLDKPNPMPVDWENGKFFYDAHGKMHYKTSTSWEEILMPTDDSFVPGYYIFK